MAQGRKGGGAEAGLKPLPKHALIADKILGRIESGEWKPGDQLPSEAKLSAELSASLGTVQKALQRLSERRILRREHGRGTFVNRDQIPEANVRHFRFFDEDGATLLPIVSRVCKIERIGTRGPWATFLGPAETYVRIERTICVNGEFELYSEVYLSAASMAPILEMQPAELNDVSIREFLSAQFHVPTLSVDQTVRIQTLPPRVTKALHLPRGTVGLVWEIAGRTYRDAPITWQRAYVPPTDRPLHIAGQWK